MKYVSLDNLSRFKASLDQVLNSKQEKLSAAQIKALNSGITSERVHLYNTAIGDLSIEKSETTKSCILTFNATDVSGGSEQTQIEIPYGSLIKSLGYNKDTKTLSLALDNDAQTVFSVELEDIATLDDLETLADTIDAAKEDKPTTSLNTTQALANYVFRDNVETTYTKTANDSVILVIPENVSQGFISLLTLMQVNDNTLFTIDNQSSYSTKIVANNATITGDSYRVISTGKKIIFARCDGVNIEILIIEEILANE